MKKIFNILILILAAIFILKICYAQTVRKLTFFYSPSCHKCAQFKEEVIPELKKEFKDKLEIDYRNIEDLESYKLLLSIEEKYKIKAPSSPPILYFEGKFLSADKEVKDKLGSLLGYVNPKETEPTDIDLVSRFKNFGFLAIVGAGLIDGINPCAFTVIVFFISFLALQGYRRRQLIAIGLAFIFAVFITYILIGVGLFSFLYEIKGFWLVVKIFNYTVGALSIILGIVCIYDLIKFRKTKKTDDMILQLPQAVKNQIHKVIGQHYRVDRKEASVKNSSLIKLLLSALVTGFLVSILEAVCTGQVYLPTIAFVLKTTQLKIQALGYLLLYNSMFIAPLFVIFILALFGVTSGDFSIFLKKHLAKVKILMAVLFFGLGIFLIWR